MAGHGGGSVRGDQANPSRAGGEAAAVVCPHSLKSGPCSQCLGVVPRVVSVDATTIDGRPSGRALDPLASSQARSYYARRGGQAKGRRTHGQG
jgi:hypothetical protein